MGRVIRPLTFANVCSGLCLALLLGYGTAHAVPAAVKLAKDSVTSKQIKDGAIRTEDLSAGAVTGAKVADGSLTGADIDESTLSGVRAATADRATAADTAADAATVNGKHVQMIHFVVPAGTGVTTLASYPGLRLDASCAADADLSAKIYFASGPVHWQGIGEVTTNAGSTSVWFDANASDVDLEASIGEGYDGLYEASIFSDTGRSISIQLALADHNAQRCSVVGTLIGG